MLVESIYPVLYGVYTYYKTRSLYLNFECGPAFENC